MTSRRSITTFTLITFVSACGAEINFGARPLGRPATTSSEQCFHARRLEVATGSAVVQWTESAGRNYIREIRERQQGLVFYRGGRRLTPTATLDLLGDRELQRAYGDKLEELDARYSRARSAAAVGYVGFFGGMAALLAYGTATQTDIGEPEPANASQRKTVMLGLAGIALLSIPFLMFGTFTLAKRRQRFEAYRALLFEASILPRVEHRIAEYNATAARACGH